ncbi:hypothetical protein FQN54_007649 [Arachnomyces sp. PD_36]|nr:hypothetical protein FQN54_007649 [Arachnomyces sp. PD_36]
MSVSVAIARALLRREEEEFDGDKCTFDICDIEDSYYKYQPSLIANAILAGVFGFSCIAFLGQGIFARRWLGFTIAMGLGTAVETVGYVGRIMMHDNPWAQNPFMIQIICLTFAPAFLAAGIYFTLSRIVTVFGSESSRIPPKWYPRIFIPCDFVALVLQSAGGAIASSADTQEDSDMGTNIMIAGLAFQVITVFAFMALSTDFAIRTYRRMRAMGTAALDARHQRLRSSFFFRAFLGALSLATFCIFVRSCYRVAELSGGWDGELMSDEPLFIALESVLIAVACLALNAFHPGLCFREGYDGVASMELKSTAGESSEEFVSHQTPRWGQGNQV